MKVFYKKYPRILPSAYIDWKSVGYKSTVRKYGPLRIRRFYETVYSSTLKQTKHIILEKQILLFK